MNFALFPLIFLVFFPASAYAVTPLYYHTFAVAEIEASVEGICIAGIPTLNTGEFMLKKSREESTHVMEVQKIKLKVKRVLRYKKRDAAVPAVKGEIIEVTNSFADQTAPFKVGDRIRVRVRLVLPEEKYNASDTRKEWWFFPTGEKEERFPPRHPFSGIKIIK